MPVLPHWGVPRRSPPTGSTAIQSRSSGATKVPDPWLPRRSLIGGAAWLKPANAWSLQVQAVFQRSGDTGEMAHADDPATRGGSNAARTAGQLTHARLRGVRRRGDRSRAREDAKGA